MKQISKKEIWLPIEGTNSKYYVSNKGHIMTKRQRKGVIALTKQKTGYYYAMIEIDGQRKNCRVHRLVAMAFIPQPPGMNEINHLDGNKANNCVENLEWANRSRNVKHAYATGLKRPHKWTYEEKMQISKSLKITLSKKREKESIENGELWFDFS